MEKQILLDRISVNPNICFGKPCIKGTRIWVSLILDFLATGDTFETILDNYPQIKKEDILACLAYGAAMSHENFVDINFATAA
jgi:uncharacterized protein (DUF433 family)